ncbi:MAG: RluA family pseudouridine synthase [Planctomycetota bacterium]|nr:RluA family pseudouridine synthase [Planctomycetota bacterium]
MLVPILFSDEAYVAVAKPAGLVVHQAPGPGPSLLRVLQDEHGLAGLTLVHRLDRDVSGVLLLGRTKEAAAAAHRRWDEARKVYRALVEGAPPSAEGLVDAPILEHQTDRVTRMESALRWHREHHPGVALPPPPPPKTSAVHPAGRASQTEYRVAASIRTRTGVWSWMDLRPRQGRMHQIRVHLKHLGTPLACDKLYGARAFLRACDFDGSTDERAVLERLPLHALRLTLPHPLKDGAALDLEAPLPADFEALNRLLKDAEASG